ncbi:MAG: transcriptional regulator [Porphyrobacter sp.]|jgi:phage repressor protein C with HTH and peptisase S24 domain|nr:transcriptional regulator [Porphyrobacter sp.]
MVNRTTPPPDGPRARLLALAQERGVSLAALSDLIGRNPTYLQQFIRKGSPRRLEEDDRRKLAAFFGITEDELRETQEKSYGLTAAPAALGEWVDVPRLDLDASAGPGAMPPGEERALGTLRFSRRWLAQQGLAAAQLSAITVAGDSMEPVLNDGDEILVDCSARPFRDGIYVVRLGDTLLVKRVAQAGAGRLALLSQNLAYPPIEVGIEDAEIIGRVVWKGGRV